MFVHEQVGFARSPRKKIQDLPLHGKALVSLANCHLVIAILHGQMSYKLIKVTNVLGGMHDHKQKTFSVVLLDVSVYACRTIRADSKQN